MHSKSAVEVDHLDLLVQLYFTAFTQDINKNQLTPNDDPDLVEISNEKQISILQACLKKR